MNALFEKILIDIPFSGKKWANIPLDIFGNQISPIKISAVDVLSSSVAEIKPGQTRKLKFMGPPNGPYFMTILGPLVFFVLIGH